MAAVNPLTLARAAYGMLLAAVPGLVVRAYGGQPGRADRTVARVLGWRQLIQAGACAWRSRGRRCCCSARRPMLPMRCPRWHLPRLTGRAAGPG